MKRIACLIILTSVALAARPSGAQDVSATVSVDSLTVGDRFAITVRARHDFAAEATFPPLRADSLLRFGDAEVLAVRSQGSRTTSGARFDSVVYEAVTFALDTALVAPIPILFRAGEDTFSVRTQPVLVPVVSLVPDDAGELQDLAPLVEFPAPWWPVAAALAVLVVLALLAFLYLRRQRGTKPSTAAALHQLEPDREAFERLDALEGVDLREQANVKPFYDELSAILRTYAQRRLDVHALEMTTAEIVRDLRRRDIPDEETTGRLRNVLTASDYVKFADAVPPVDDGTRWLSVSRDAIRSIEAHLHPPESPDGDAESLQ